MLALLRQPYPCEISNWRDSIKLAFLIGFFVATFLLVFQPFGLHRIPDEYKLVIISGYSLVTFCCMLAFRWIVINLIFQTEDDPAWTTGKEILQNLGVLLLISLGNFLYTIWIGGINWSWSALLMSIGVTFAVGVFPVFGSFLLSMVWVDIRASRKLETMTKQWFLSMHISRMMGAFIVTFTAFLVLNWQSNPVFIAWLLPTVAFTPVTIYFQRKFVKRREKVIGA